MTQVGMVAFTRPIHGRRWAPALAAEVPLPPAMNEVAGGARFMERAAGLAIETRPNRHRSEGAVTTVRHAQSDPGDIDARAAVDAVLRGDRDAFRLLVERESAGVVGVCLRVLGDFHEAEDVAQEAFVTAFRSLSTWRGDGPFGAWLARIAVRIAIRRAAGRKNLTWIEPADDAAEPVGSRTDAREAGDPLGQALRGERAGAVRRAVAALDEPYREVVALRFFGDLSLVEIAAVTRRPLATVKTHLRRGLLRLRAVDSLERVR